MSKKTLALVVFGSLFASASASALTTLPVNQTNAEHIVSGEKAKTEDKAKKNDNSNADDVEIYKGPKFSDSELESI